MDPPAREFIEQILAMGAETLLIPHNLGWIQSSFGDAHLP